MTKELTNKKGGVHFSPDNKDIVVDEGENLVHKVIAALFSPHTSVDELHSVVNRLTRLADNQSKWRVTI